MIVGLYMSVYRRLVQFRTPAFMMLRAMNRGEGNSSGAVSSDAPIEDRG